MMGSFSRLEGGGPAPDALPSSIAAWPGMARDIPNVCDPGQPVPFEELWSGFVAHAARTLDPLLDSALHQVVLRDPQGPLRSLLLELAAIGAQAAFNLFGQFRSREASVSFIYEGVPASRDAYEAFLEDLSAGQLAPLWEAFPALRRLLALRTDLFVESTIEFCERWKADREEIVAAFPALRGDVRPRRLRPYLSDSHSGGRTVMRLEFEAGQTLFYKPRPVDMEWGFAQFVEWFNQQDHGFPRLRALAALRRLNYGWMEEARPAPCASHDAVAQFYRRAGMILALVDLFCGVDLHSENLIASGEHPVLVDIETLFHPPGPFEAPSPEPQNELMRTELLPRPIPTADGAPYVLSGLGVIPGGLDIRFRQRGWCNINRDDMTPCHLDIPCSAGAVPRALEGSSGPVSAWVDEIVWGFLSLHKFFRWRRSELWRDDGPIARAFGGGRTRFVLRATRVYADLLRRAAQPQSLTTESGKESVFERLAREGQVWQELYGMERQALGRWDIPSFQAQTTARFIQGEERIVPEFFASSGFSLARSRAESIDDAALHARAKAIRKALENSIYPNYAAGNTTVQAGGGA
jgi:class II lanthipeptide synthase